MSKRVQPMKSGKYIRTINHASWEYEMISETEALLEPYREMLEALIQHISNLNKDP
ncbi:hypothetical protein ACLB1E_34160 [Escherichia coli]